MSWQGQLHVRPTIDVLGAAEAVEGRPGGKRPVSGRGDDRACFEGEKGAE